MTKKTINTRKCGSCNRWYNGCYDTDSDFYIGDRDASNCKYFEEKKGGKINGQGKKRYNFR